MGWTLPFPKEIVLQWKSSLSLRKSFQGSWTHWTLMTSTKFFLYNRLSGFLCYIVCVWGLICLFLNYQVHLALKRRQITAYFTISISGPGPQIPVHKLSSLQFECRCLSLLSGQEIHLIAYQFQCILSSAGSQLYRGRCYNEKDIATQIHIQKYSNTTCLD